ncbi:sensor histidine kinase [Streptosporangium sp. G11]|uniref:sensor histidine kinase n=1 Tax=Streptosporangium sp. G11 TaxID=3436926 RepID=UPI003EBC0135
MISAVLNALWDTLARGDADPPTPRSPRLRWPMPRWAGPLPFRTIDVVRVGDLVLACLFFGSTLSEFLNANELLWATRPLVGVPVLLVYVAALAFSVPLALRDRWPLAAWRTAALSYPFAIYVTTRLNPNDLPYSTPAAITYLLVLYAVGLRVKPAVSLVVWFLTVLALWVGNPDTGVVIEMIVVTVAVLFGYNVRVRRSATAKLVEGERRTELAEGAQAVLAERTRIARELHDVVAHHMSVIAIQAEAVPLEARGDPELLEKGLAQIRGLSLEAMAELRQVLGVLRDEEGRTDTAPQPGLDRVEELVATTRAAGIAVAVKRSGPLEGLPSAVELAVYRITQESLSNAMRHAPGSAVAVEITRTAQEVRLRVLNGPGGASPGLTGAGHGLLGMRERATLLGGTLEAGPLAGGGFEVRAVLPVPDEGKVRS